MKVREDTISPMRYEDIPDGAVFKAIWTALGAGFYIKPMSGVRRDKNIQGINLKDGSYAGSFSVDGCTICGYYPQAELVLGKMLP